MSKENARKFLDTLNNKDARLAWKAKTAGVKNDAEAIEMAVDMAEEMGFDVTKEDITAALKDLKAEQAEKTQKAVKGIQKLDLHDLEDVAGGVYHYEVRDNRECRGGEWVKVNRGCRENFDDTFCMNIDACTIFAVYYYDCTGKQFGNNAEYNCSIDFYKRYVVD